MHHRSLGISHHGRAVVLKHGASRRPRLVEIPMPMCLEHMPHNAVTLTKEPGRILMGGLRILETKGTVRAPIHVSHHRMTHAEVILMTTGSLMEVPRLRLTAAMRAMTSTDNNPPAIHRLRGSLVQAPTSHRLAPTISSHQLGIRRQAMAIRLRHMAMATHRPGHTGLRRAIRRIIHLPDIRRHPLAMGELRDTTMGLLRRTMATEHLLSRTAEETTTMVDVMTGGTGAEVETKDVEAKAAAEVAAAAAAKAKAGTNEEDEISAGAHLMQARARRKCQTLR